MFLPQYKQKPIDIPDDAIPSKQRYWSGDHIANGLYLGDANASNDHDWLMKENITTVIRTIHRDETILHEYPGITYHYYPICDGCDDIVKAVKVLYPIVDNALVKGEHVLVHCRAGKSRSASIVIAYIMISQKVDYHTAYDIVAQKREIIDPHFRYAIALINM
jgi:protein tyrosine phosphatase